MSHLLRPAILALAMASVAAQAPSRGHVAHRVLWVPPEISLPDEHPESSIPQEMIGRLTVGSTTVVLNQTSRITAQKALGGTVGQQGDAGDWEAWLCYSGHNSHGPWILWLLSSEIDNESVSGFQWMQLSSGQVPDPRCKFLPGEEPVKLPIELGLASSESEVRRVLGKPTLASGNLLEFSHEHQQTTEHVQSTVTNDVDIVLEKGQVRTILVWRSDTT